MSSDQFEEEHACACVMPELAIQWFLQYACTSNRDLAVISSINRKMREVTLSFFHDMVKEAVLPLQLAQHSGQQQPFQFQSASASATLPKYLKNNGAISAASHISKFRETPSSSATFTYTEISKLLLPDMLLEILKRRLKYCHPHIINNREYTKPTFALESDVVPSSSSLLDRESESFCLAWFHPRGIRIRTLDIAKNEEDEDYSSSDDYISTSTSNLKQRETLNNIDLSMFSTNSNKESAAARSTTTRIKANRKSDRSCSSSESYKTVTDEWRSYQNATDVLFPLGYATRFVRDALALAAEYDLSSIIPSNANRNGQGQNIESALWGCYNLSKPRRSNFVVRGASFARPHGFCLCWSDEADSFKGDLNLLGQDLRGKLDMRNEKHRQIYYRLKAKHRRDRKRRIRMRYSLPRIALSTMAKNPDYQALPHQSLVGKLEGRRQRCVQFLNADKTKAVYMRTHPFDCGPVVGPVTMFLVAIATEDGCFVSGLNSRFELGHNYGNDSDDLVEMSPISLATDGSIAILNRIPGTSLNGSVASSRRSSIRSSVVGDSDDSSVENDEMDDMGDLNCRCKIQCPKRFERSEDSYEDEESTIHPKVDQERIIRGTMGPGRWHLYTAIFYGDESVLRVDGVDEPTDLPHKTSTKGKDAPVLDGLTIGSDHVFDMSLCFGEGSDGEGEGSIAELAVFKGAMDKCDIECFERYLMKKHGIIHGSTGFKQKSLLNAGVDQKFPDQFQFKERIKEKDGDQWQEDQWMRDVHSLMAHAPPFTASGGSIPLRFAARHRSVAWQRSCDVTGKPIRVSRIGSKLSTGSSDW